MAQRLWYRAGVVNAVNGSNIVSGTATFWLTTIRVGDMFSITENGSAYIFYEVVSVDDNSQITIDPPYQEASVNGANYAIIRNFTGQWSLSADFATQVRQQIERFDAAMKNNFKGDKGDAGRDGNTILGDIGAPSQVIGNEGDWFIDMSTWDMYRKEAGAWILRGTLRGAKGDAGQNGTTWHASQTPNDNTGSVGDFNFNGVTGDVHQRTITGWVPVGNFRGPQGDRGDQGDQGLRGLTGLAGSRWFTGAGVPAGSLGVDTDMYLNTANGDTFRKSSNVWTPQNNIRGPVGAQGVPGSAGMVWRGAWNSTTQYEIRDGVTHFGNSWIATATNTNVSPPANSSTTTNEAWSLIAARGADGLGAGDMMKAVYDPTGSGTVLTATHATSADSATSAGTAAVAQSVDFADVDGVPHSSISARGIIRLATTSETIDGTLADVAVTPTGLKSALSDVAVDVANATETTAGIIRIATAAEVTAGTSAVTAITPATLKAVVDGIKTGGMDLPREVLVALSVSNWFGRTAPAISWVSIAWSPTLNLFAAVAIDGKAMTSPDGITWTARTAPAGSWASIAWSPTLNLFAAVAGDGKAMTSPDGITWTARTAPAGGWYGIAWSPTLNLFAAVASNGAAMTNLVIDLGE